VRLALAAVLVDMLVRAYYQDADFSANILGPFLFRSMMEAHG